MWRCSRYCDNGPVVFLLTLLVNTLIGVLYAGFLLRCFVRLGYPMYSAIKIVDPSHFPFFHVTERARVAIDWRSVSNGRVTQVCRSCNNRSQALLLTSSAGSCEYVLDTGGLPKYGADPWTRKDSFHFPIFQPPVDHDFECLVATWWQYPYESLYASGRVMGVGETLLKTVSPFPLRMVAFWNRSRCVRVK